MNARSILLFILFAVVAQLSKAVQNSYPKIHRDVHTFLQDAVLLRNYDASCNYESNQISIGTNSPAANNASTHLVKGLLDDILGNTIGSEAKIIPGQLSYSKDAAGQLYCPPMDLVEDTECYRYYLELPGFQKSEVSIQLLNSGKELVISAVRNQLTENDSSGDQMMVGAKNTVRKLIVERKTGRFERRISLPENIDRSSISAEMKDGVLEVTIQKLISSCTIEIR